VSAPFGRAELALEVLDGIAPAMHGSGTCAPYRH
jgi:hypothetical protein